MGIEYWSLTPVPIDTEHLFSVEAQEFTPATTPGNSQIGIKEPIPPAYETLHAAVNGSKVRIRRIRIYPEEYSHNSETVRFRRRIFPVLGANETTQIFHEVAATWKQLVHRNVAPLLDFTIDPSQLVLDWLSDEDVRSYVANHPDADRLNLVC